MELFIALLIMLAILAAFAGIVYVCIELPIQVTKKAGLSSVIGGSLWTTGNSTLVCDSRNSSSYALWKTPTGRFFKADYDLKKIYELEDSEALALVAEFASPSEAPMLIETFFDGTRLA